MKVDVVILAAGKGTRMYSDTPKVLHSIGGKAMAQHVVDTAKSLGDVALHVIIGHGAEQVRETLTGVDRFIEQTEQLGTGHAVSQALPSLREGATTLILYGDVPLIKAETLSRLIEKVSHSSMAMLTVNMDDPDGYGRIIRDANKQVVAIVEQKDASDKQLQITEINTGIMCVKQQQLAEWLPQLSNDNAQQEYYLTDIIAMAVNQAVEVRTEEPTTAFEVEGVNNKLQLATLERAYQQIKTEELLLAGVSMADPSRVDIRGELVTGKDVFIDINAVFSGEVKLGDNVSIGPNCVIHDATIESGTQIFSHTLIESASVAPNCQVGPFARLRPGAKLQQGAKVGNFVEVKNSTLGKGSKANHLAYIGDAEIGSGSNIGAGTITCNYDGANKYKTTLGDNVFIGSNSTLVAPLKIETGGFVGAGSTITQTVPGDTLAVSRGKQRNIDGWKRPKKKTR